MSVVDRRRFLQGAAAVSGIALVRSPLQALLSAAAQPGLGDFGVLGPVADLRDGKVRLHLPPLFSYRSFHDTDGPAVVLPDGTILPGRHEGMAAFAAPGGNVWLVRNHNRGGPGPAFGPTVPYDPLATGGVTTVLATSSGEVIDAFTSLSGTLYNAGGARTPWETWLSCQKTINGPDVAPDFTGASNVPLQQMHGFIFEVPAGGIASAVPIRSAGRFLHDSAALDPETGILYLTEDNFSFPSGLYRYIPPVHPMIAGRIEDGGRLQMLRIAGQPNANLAVMHTAGATFPVEWVDIADPAPSFPYTPGVVAPTSNDAASLYVGDQGRAEGAAYFSRLEGAVFSRGEIYFASTQGGGSAEPSFGPIFDGYGNGTGQLWSYDPATQTLTCRYQSPGAGVLGFPDNIAVRTERGTIVLCEDGPVENYMRALMRGGELLDIALNRLTRNDPPFAPRFSDEFAGATFAPDGHTLFVNIQATQGLTFAIWGPWGRLGL